MANQRTSDSTADAKNCVSLLRSMCHTEDILIVPEFSILARSHGGEIFLPTKSGEFKVPGKRPEKEDSDEENIENSDSLPPPQVLIVCDKSEAAENPSAIICKNIFVEFSLIRAIGKTLTSFPTIGSLRIENCCISKELAEGLAGILADGSGRQIFDLSLDGNPNVHQILPLFLSMPNGLKILSLQRCELDDEGIKKLASSLSNVEGKEPTLLVLNLGLNKIGNIGAGHLANALRTNRTLLSLSLEGNQIGNEGAFSIAQVLQKFHLTEEEIIFRRKRIFKNTLEKSNSLNMRSETLIEKRKTETETSKTTGKLSERSGSTVPKRIRGPDGKFCLSGIEKKSKINSSKLNSGDISVEKTRHGKDEHLNYLFSPSKEHLLKQQNVSEQSDNHPLVNETFTNGGKVWCNGCWSLLRINLAYNLLNENAVGKFVDVITYQMQTFKFPKERRLKIILSPGNFIMEDVDDMEKLIENREEGLTMGGVWDPSQLKIISKE